MVNGAEMRYPVGTFYIEWWEGASRKRLAVGKDAAQAQAQRLRKQTQLDAKERGLTVTDSGSAGPMNLLSDACSLYLEDVRLAKKDSTFDIYRVALDHFQQSCTKKHLEEIDKRDLLGFVAFLRDKKEQSPRSVHNKFVNILTFLKAQGIRGLVTKNDWPRYVEGEVEIYEDDVLDKLFNSCYGKQRLLYRMLLMGGLREQEAMYLEWPDIDVKNKEVVVRWKSQYNWSPKAYKGRSVPVPDTLIKEVIEYRKSLKSFYCQLVFPTDSCKPDSHMLRALKRAAKRAGIPEDSVWLHKFRATFCTLHLRAGVDLRTVQDWMGHTDMASTLRYLKPNRGQAIRDKVNATFG